MNKKRESETEENGGKRKTEGLGNMSFGKMSLWGKNPPSKMHLDDLLTLHEKDRRFKKNNLLSHGLCALLYVINLK